jgi:hypothetical protein
MNWLSSDRQNRHRDNRRLGGAISGIKHKQNLLYFISLRGVDLWLIRASFEVNQT